MQTESQRDVILGRILNGLRSVDVRRKGRRASAEGIPDAVAYHVAVDGGPDGAALYVRRDEWPVDAFAVVIVSFDPAASLLGEWSGSVVDVGLQATVWDRVTWPYATPQAGIDALVYVVRDLAKLDHERRAAIAASGGEA
jgi:hypothetical protein